MNLVVSVTALFSGLFIIFFGGLADRIGPSASPSPATS